MYASDDDHQDPAQHQVRFDLAADFQTVHVRELPVQQHQMCRLLAQGGQHLRASGRRDRGIAGLIERAAGGSRHIGVIVHHENANRGFHNLSLRLGLGLLSCGRRRSEPFGGKLRGEFRSRGGLDIFGSLHGASRKRGQPCKMVSP